MTEDAGAAPAAQAFAAAKRGEGQVAAAIIGRLAAEEFGLDVTGVGVATDSYSLNSVHGLLYAGPEEFFFKFHHEEGEERTLREFYQAELLRTAGYPVDAPLHMSRKPGRQLLLYRRRHTPRFADLCRRLDSAPATELKDVFAAQAALDATTLGIYRASLHRTSEDEVAAEPLNQLFHARLIDPGNSDRLGGRARRFFFDREFDLAGVRIAAEELCRARWRINGIDYADTIGDLLERSRLLLEPRRLARFGAVVGHGDAHNANVWWEEGPPPHLVLFDPAFAGAHMPALIAEAKATFHNILAHPDWLYFPATAAGSVHVAVRLQNETIELETDWRLTPLRQGFLAGKEAGLWRPLLAEMRQLGVLDPAWRETLRAALFCCPALVMDLAAGAGGGHNPLTSALGLAICVMAGAEPVHRRSDTLSDFFDAIAPDQ